MLDSLLGQCLHVLDGGAGFAGVASALFFAGLLGGFTHCAFMCAPFVLMQTARNLERTSAARMSELTRLRGALLIPYHLGRMTTYAALGGAAAVLVGGFALWWTGVAAALLGLAGLVLVAAAFPIKIVAPRFLNRTNALLLQIVAPLTRSPGRISSYLLGVTLGLLPCGMVYGALLAASATANIAYGALSMAAFAAGTVPGLIATAVAGNLVMDRYRGQAVFFARLGSALAGLWLCGVSVRLFLS